MRYVRLTPAPYLLFIWHSTSFNLELSLIFSTTSSDEFELKSVLLIVAEVYLFQNKI